MTSDRQDKDEIVSCEDEQFHSKDREQFIGDRILWYERYFFN